MYILLYLVDFITQPILGCVKIVMIFGFYAVISQLLASEPALLFNNFFTNNFRSGFHYQGINPWLEPACIQLPGLIGGFN